MVSTITTCTSNKTAKPEGFSQTDILLEGIILSHSFDREFKRTILEIKAAETNIEKDKIEAVTIRGKPNIRKGEHIIVYSKKNYSGEEISRQIFSETNNLWYYEPEQKKIEYS